LSEQMKIAMISVHSCPLGKLGSKDTGGMNVYIKELAYALGQRGHIVDIYTRAHDTEHQSVIELANNIRLIHLGIGNDDDIPKLAIYTYLQDYMCGVENFRKARDIDYDIIHSHYWLSGLIGKQLKSWWHIPHLCMFHTLGAIKNSIGIGEDEPELRVESERDIVRASDRIIAATEREKQELTAYYGALSHKISVIPCGVNTELFNHIDKYGARQKLGLDHENIILFVGRVEPLKGLRQMLKALPLITTREPVRLMIVGGDETNKDELEILRSMSGDLQIEEKVTFVGQVTHDTLPLFYGAADVCVVPSYYESFGMVALESLACGTPIVTTDVGGMRNIILSDEIGYIVDNNAPQQLATHISKILSLNGKSVKSARSRRDAIQKFAWSNIADELLNEYKKVLQQQTVIQ